MLCVFHSVHLIVRPSDVVFKLGYENLIQNHTNTKQRVAKIVIKLSRGPGCPCLPLDSHSWLTNVRA